MKNELLLNHERTMINHIILENWVTFQTQAWLLPELPAFL